MRQAGHSITPRLVISGAHITVVSQSTRTLTSISKSLSQRPSPSPKSNIIYEPVRHMSIGFLSTKERVHHRNQRKGRHIYVPAYINARELSHRLRLTIMQLHKSGSLFFPWWPRASEKQLKKDGFAMLRDLTLRFDEVAVLCKRLGLVAIYEHTGLERIRNEHYNLTKRINDIEQKGYVVSYQKRKELAKEYIGVGTGPRPLPEHEKPSYVQPKQPVVCIVGHVDHGKTTLLDALRETFVAAREDAGITQDLYSYQAHLGRETIDNWNTKPEYSDASIPNKPPSSTLKPLDDFEKEDLLEMYEKVTFLDTPGHASFFDMRENGVLFCDCVLLIVSAVDGVCSQTLESIEYIKTFNTPVLVALTKCDLPESQPKKVAKQLRDAGLFVIPHDQPGAFDQLLAPEKNKRSKYTNQISPYVCISAKTGLNMDTFKESLMKVFMTMKPQCDTLAPPVGLILEAINEEGGRGRVLRVLMSSGTMSPKDSFITGIFDGRVKDIRMYGDVDDRSFITEPSEVIFPNNNRDDPVGSFSPDNHRLGSRRDRVNRDRSSALSSRRSKLGERIHLAVPGVPVEIIGVNGVPQAGDDIRIIPDAMLAKTIADTRRLEMEYPDQSRFSLGGLTPHSWTPPPLTFLSDLKKDRNAFLKDIDESAIVNLNVVDAGGVVQDIDTDQETQGFVFEDYYNDVEDDVEIERESDNDVEVENEFESDIENDFMDLELEDDLDVESQLETSQTNQSLEKDTFKHFDVDEEKVIGNQYPNWDVIHDNEPLLTYQKPFIIKAGTAGYLRMIVGSINAFNDRYPNHLINIAYSGLGSLTEKDLTEVIANVDKDIDKDMECPILLFRTRTPQEKMLRRAKQAGAKVYEYAVFDDLIKHMIGETKFNEMFHDSDNLRLHAPGTSFVDEPLDTPETNESELLKAMRVKETTRRSKVRSSLGSRKTLDVDSDESHSQTSTKSILQSSSILPDISSMDGNDYNPSLELAATILNKSINETRQSSQARTPMSRRSLGKGTLSNIMSKPMISEEVETVLKTMKTTLTGTEQEQPPVVPIPEENKKLQNIDLSMIEDAIHTLERRK